MIISDGKEYKSWDELVAAWKAEEKLWPWYKKLYFAWLRGPFWPSKIWYWIRCHTFTRYHILDMRNKEYKYGYADPRSLVVYACFKILVDFIDLEKPRERICLETDAKEGGGHWTRALNEMDVLYKYWKEDRYLIEDYMKREDQDQVMLKRLIEVREYMWT